MKKIILILLLTQQIVFAQTDSAFKKGDNLLSVSLGIGIPSMRGITKDYPTISSIPPINIIYGRGITDNFEMGMMFTYQRSKVDFFNSTSSFGQKTLPIITWKNFVVCVRGIYHLKLKVKKLDPYMGVAIGVRIYHDGIVQFNNDLIAQNPNPTFSSKNPNSVHFLLGGFIGARYSLTNHIGAFGEFGYDISYGRIGVVFKL